MASLRCWRSQSMRALWSSMVAFFSPLPAKSFSSSLAISAGVLATSSNDQNVWMALGLVT